MQTATECTVGEISQIFDVIRQVDDINRISLVLSKNRYTGGNLTMCTKFDGCCGSCECGDSGNCCVTFLISYPGPRDSNPEKPKP